jgi:hypothetical protein
MSHSASGQVISPGKAVEDSLVVNLHAGNQPAYATQVYDPGQLPTVLGHVEAEIGQNQARSVWDTLQGAILADLKFRRPFAFAAGAWSQERGDLFRTMSTGASEYAFDLPNLGLAPSSPTRSAASPQDTRRPRSTSSTCSTATWCRTRRAGTW